MPDEGLDAFKSRINLWAVSARNFAHRLRRPTAAPASVTSLQPALIDRAAIEREYARMPLAARHPYLEDERRIPVWVLGSPRFLGRVRVDDRGNAIFPHFDLSGLCGFEKKNWPEKKNRASIGLAAGGTKGLWGSHDLADDDCLVLTKSAIDALSYAAMFLHARARYRSTGGQVNDPQPALIRAAVLDLPEGSEVIAATDNDDTGRKLAAVISYAVGAAGRPDLKFRAHHPVNDGADWNDVLHKNRLNAFSR